MVSYLIKKNVSPLIECNQHILFYMIFFYLCEFFYAIFQSPHKIGRWKRSNWW